MAKKISMMFGILLISLTLLINADDELKALNCAEEVCYSSWVCVWENWGSWVEICTEISMCMCLPTDINICSLLPNYPGCADGEFSSENVACEAVLDYYNNGDSSDGRGDDPDKAQGTGSFLKVIGSNPSQTQIAAPDSNLFDDNLAFESGDDPRIYKTGISSEIFAFDYKDGISIEDSYLQAVLNDQGGQSQFQKRTYGFLRIPEEGWYGFAVKANRSTSGDEACFYCGRDQFTNEHEDFCTRDGGSEPRLKVCTLPGVCYWDNLCCTSCTSSRSVCGTRYGSTCTAGCKNDCQGEVVGWLAMTGEGTPDNHFVARSFNTGSFESDFFENNVLEYENDWQMFSFFSHDEVNPNDVEGTEVQWAAGYYSAGYYPFQFSGSWKRDNSIIKPELWWRKYGVSGIEFEEKYTQGSGQGAAFSACQPGETCAISVVDEELLPTVVEAGETFQIQVRADDPVDSSITAQVTTGSDAASVSLKSQSGADWYFDVTTSDAASDTAVTIRFTGTAGSASCADNYSFSVTRPDSWWQVGDADVWTSGSLASFLPAGEFFDLAGAGGYPGVPAYGVGTNLLTGADPRVSAKGWLAKAESKYASLENQYNFRYFDRRVPSAAEDSLNTASGDLTPGVLTAMTVAPDGYYWIKMIGETTVSGNFGTAKVVVFVDEDQDTGTAGTLTINGDLTVDDQGFFMAIVKGEAGGDGIIVDPEVTTVEGVLVTDETFATGTNGVDADSTLNVTGVVVAYNGVNLKRDLADNDDPAEVFTYLPPMLFQIPFTHKKIRWLEVAP